MNHYGKPFCNHVYLRIRVTDYCSQYCVHCPDSRMFSQKNAEIEPLKLEKYLNNLVTVHAKNQVTLLLTGGEPFDAKEFLEVLRICSIWEPRHLILATNGLRLIDDPFLLKQFLLHPPDEIWLSSEWSAEKYAQIRNNKNGFHEIFNMAKELKKKDPALVLTINLTYSGEQPEILEEFLSNTSDVPIDTIRIMRLKTHDSRFISTEEQWMELKEQGYKHNFRRHKMNLKLPWIRFYESTEVNLTSKESETVLEYSP